MTFVADKDLDDKAAILYLMGLSMGQVGQRIGKNSDWVRSSLKRTKTPTRSHRDAKTVRQQVSLRLSPERR